MTAPKEERISEILTDAQIRKNSIDYCSTFDGQVSSKAEVHWANGARFALAAAAEREKVWQEFAAELMEWRKRGELAMHPTRFDHWIAALALVKEEKP